MPTNNGIKIGPPPVPNRKEYPFVGTINFQGMTIHVENLAGSAREGTGPGGKKWRTVMKNHYGEIVGTKGTDRDKLDVYVGPNLHSKRVFVVHQAFPGNHPKAGRFDEDKVMVGFDSPEAAKRAYLKHYDRRDYFRSMTEWDIVKFKKAIYGENKGEKVAMTPEQFCQKLAACATKGKKKKKRYPSAFIRTKLGTIDEAYELGARQALMDMLEKAAIELVPKEVAKERYMTPGRKPVPISALKTPPKKPMKLRENLISRI